MDSNGQVNRKYERRGFNAPVVIYDTRGFICSKGNRGLVSNGGLGLIGPIKQLELGQSVTIEFLGSKDMAPFWARGEVVSFVNLSQKEVVGIKFTALNSVAEKVLVNYTEEPMIEGAR